MIFKARMSKVKIIVVGAGAVGTVYGRYFQLGGADVSFYVREKYADSCRRGFRFYPMNRPRSQRPVGIEMKNFDILTDVSEVKGQKWDYIVLAMSSVALRGPWLQELIQAMGHATLVTLQPGIYDREYILHYIDSSRLIEGMIPILSYATPLPGDTQYSEGIAYWLPPGVSGTLSGQKDLVRRLIQILRKGGFPAKMSADVRAQLIVPSTILNLIVVALEISGWSFADLTKGAHLKLACQAIAEALRVLSGKKKVTHSLLSFLNQPLLFKIILILSSKIVPFDFEAYMKAHFMKVQKQIHQSLVDYINLAKTNAIPVPALSKLLSDLR